MAARPGGGKERASRIPLNYYKKRDAIARWKLGLSLLAALFTLGWWATGFSLGGPGLVSQNAMGRLRASHGPLTRAHATWDARCDACHASFQPIGDDSWTRKIGLTSASADTRCQSCHAVLDHHAETGKPGDTALKSCGGCHRDHQGRDASLVRLPASDCTSCHKDLKGHTQTGAASFASAITSFAGDHPEFALIKQKQGDLGTLKFNHALHMSKGLIEGETQKPVFTLAQLGEEDQKRYAREGQGASDGVQLECASCHRPDNGKLPPASSPLGVEAMASLLSSGTGGYMKPISYRTDCAACHKLEVIMARGEAETKVTVPHRLQPSALHETLTNLSIGLSLGKDVKTLEKFTPSSRPRPGRRDEAEQSAREEVQARVTKAERILLGEGKGTCTECHQYRPSEGTITSKIDFTRRLDEYAVEPTFVETVWYKHALFDHFAHRGVSCQGCHESAYPNAPKPSRSNDDVLIPGKSSCVQCHAPEGRDGQGNPTGGAGQDCTECHTYHADEQSPGVHRVEPLDRLKFAEFLKGTGDGKGP